VTETPRPVRAEDLVGLFGPDWTGGLCSVDYVRWQRGARPEELDCAECRAAAAVAT